MVHCLRSISCEILILFLLQQLYMVLLLDGNINVIIQYNIKNYFYKMFSRLIDKQIKDIRV